MSLLSNLSNLNLSDSTEKVIAEYVWLGGSGMDLRSKARTLAGPVHSLHQLPKWNYNGSSTGQACVEDSEVILYPRAIFKDPFRRGNNILVLCDTYTPDGDPLPTNKRYNAAKIFSHPDVIAEEPWYGIEQQCILLQKEVRWPIGWPVGGYPAPDQEQYYCGIGAEEAVQRKILKSLQEACFYAGINISRIGHCLGISAGDELWIVRYILERITEKAGVVLSFDPKPIQGDWNAAGAARISYSTKSMRNGGGHEVIKAIEKLGLRHEDHIAAWGVANHGASIEVCRDIENAGIFYLRDNRLASNVDPYVVTSMIAETTILWQP